MRKALLFLLMAAPCFSHAAEGNCAVIGGSMEQSLFDAIVHDLNIDGATIQRDKTIVNVLYMSPVSEAFAHQLAKTDSDSDRKRNGKALLPESDYFESYYINGAKSITARYTFINQHGKRNVFIASSLMNNDECSVRFNGYLTLSRQF